MIDLKIAVFFQVENIDTAGGEGPVLRLGTTAGERFFNLVRQGSRSGGGIEQLFFIRGPGEVGRSGSQNGSEGIGQGVKQLFFGDRVMVLPIGQQGGVADGGFGDLLGIDINQCG